MKNKNNEFLLNIIAESPGHLYWKDTEGICRGANDTQAKFLGYKSGKDLIGKKDFDLFPKGQAEVLQKIDRQVMETKKEYCVEETVNDYTGKKTVFFSRKIPLFDPNTKKVIGVIGTSLDITTLKESQRAAEAASDAKTEFLENMRHDIRTPLTGIIGCAELLQFANNPQEVAEYTQDLIESSNALLQFLNNILEGIQVATGEIPLVKKKLALEKKIQEIINLNKSLAAEKQLSLKLNYDKTIPAYLIGDPVRVQRIVLELIANALTFTEKGEVNVDVNLKKTEAKHVIVEISVSDTGMGIPQNKQEEIFLRFKRLTPSYKGIYKGLGLGLTTVKQFIDDLDGEIYVESELDQGARFTCYIPFQMPLVMNDVGVELAHSLMLVTGEQIDCR
jgi:two-component system, OmpR family, aerobic respiration control sensor histidine kinase ArcB